MIDAWQGATTSNSELLRGVATQPGAEAARALRFVAALANGVRLRLPASSRDINRLDDTLSGQLPILGLTVRTGIPVVVLVLIFGTLGGAWAQATTPIVIAVLGVEFVDTSLEGSDGSIRPEEQARLNVVKALIEETLGDIEYYSVVAPAKTQAIVDEAALIQHLHECNGCEIGLGRALGADWVLIGWVQKVSNLILNLNVIVRDVSSGRVVAKAFVDLRGNTDRSWTRATHYLLDEILLERMRSHH